ncbi:uncharacterized protein LOC114157856 [Xiphophorus couchianus]|uniref:uncharacterized protein LOC114157856 n=1 Tax=Xiphophorus couchianus TaxID=32473 RepID=UPI001016C556|nr:uncharacterized protein LOC114157856 [Xiphophorus couchianus]
MGNTSPRVLVSLLLNTLLCCGQTLDPVLTVEPNWSTFYVGEFVTFICDMNEGQDTDWYYQFIRNGQQFVGYQSDKRFRVDRLYTGHSGEFQCCGQWKGSSDNKCSKTVTVTFSDKPGAKLTAGSTTIPVGGSVTLSCSVEPSAGWKYRWFRRTSDSSFVEFIRNNEENREITVTQGGIYKCDGKRGNPSFYSYSSHENKIEIMFSNKVFVTRQPNLPHIFSGESITLTCEVQGGETTEWSCEWRRSGSIIHWTDSKDWTFIVSESSRGNYMCQCRSRDDWHSSTQWSETIKLSVSRDKPGAKLTAGSTTIPVGGSVTLSCSVEPSAGWKYRWFRRTSDTSFVEFIRNNEENREITVTQGGIYKCDGKRGNPSFCSHSSHENNIEIMFSNKVFVTQQPNRPQMFSGESITLTCEVQGGETTEWTYEWRKSGLATRRVYGKDWTFRLPDSSSLDYMCRCRRRDDWYSSTKWSETITLFVSDKPRAKLRTSSTTIPGGGSVTLSCSVEPSAGWKYRWLIRISDISFVELRTNNEENRDITVTQAGIYRCYGVRENPEFYSEPSDDVTIRISLSNKVVVTRQPNRPQIFSGESITLTCEVQGGETTEWTCDWRKSGSIIQRTDSKDWTFIVSESSSGDYMCQCRSRDDWYSSTQWSETIRLSVSGDKPRAKLAAGSTTIPVGGSVTLSCSVEPSAGWRYKWFRRTSDTPEVQVRTNNKENREITVTQGGIYRCMGIREKQDFYSDSSDEVNIQIIFSNKVFVTRRPNRPLVFIGESITLTCEVQGGETTEWTCQPKAQLNSNSREIPAGGRVTLTCIVDSSSSGWKYFWYKERDSSEPLTREEAVFPSNGQMSVSEEGLYWCRGGRGRPVYYTDYSDRISITKNVTVSSPTSSSFPMMSIIGPFVGIILIILLLLLWRYRLSKDLSCLRSFQSESSSQRPTTNHGVNKTESDYSSLLHGTSSIYHIIRPRGAAGNDETVTYTKRRERPHHPEESSAYVNVRPGNNSSAGVTGSCRFQVKCISLIKDQCLEEWIPREKTPDVLNSLFCCGQAHADRPTATLTAGSTTIPVGGSVTLSCSVEPSAGWKYRWSRRTSDTSEAEITTNNEDNREITVTQGGIYRCAGERENPVFNSLPSHYVTIETTYAVLTFEPNWSTFYSGEFVTFRCDMNEGEDSDWEYKLNRNNKSYLSYIPHKSNTLLLLSGEYQCCGCRRSSDQTKCSNIVTVSADRPTATLTAGSTTIPVGGSVTLSCSVEPSAGWKYRWFRRTLDTPEAEITTNNEDNREITVTQGGIYKCAGERENPVFNSLLSHDVTIKTTSDRPTATLTAGSTTIPVGGSVTLSCSVEPSAGWKYRWFRRTSDTPEAEITTNNEDNREITVTQGGIYRCAGERENPVFNSLLSHDVTIKTTSPNKPSLILQPNWSQIYIGEKVTLRCEIQGGTEWTYEWRPTNKNSPSSSEYSINYITESHSGDYSCRGNRNYELTEWSDAVRLTVIYERCSGQMFDPVSNLSPVSPPQPVLSVSPSWPNPGASVTLSCEGLELQSEGWRFFWYKAVPDPSSRYYRFELLPGSTNGTEQNSFIINGPTHTGRFVCRAGREEPKFYTDYSEVKFAWSADPRPAASLSVNPDRVQHFRSDSVSLSCEGNSTEWRVMMFTERDGLSDFTCSHWGNMTGSTCTINISWNNNGVFWCESRSGEFSNAVNITVHDDYHDVIILVSPVHPVTEGDPVTLSCRDKKQNLLSNVFFYHNNKLINNDSREELKISAVSKSDEGFYKCQHSGKESPRSWMSVRDDDHDGVILVSPVHPVTEGDPVTLSCRDKKQNLLSNVFFYHNNKLINNDSREELKISAVSKSDEGFYKCQHSGKESPRSWMSVRVTVSSPVSSSVPVMLIVGPVVGIVLIILIILIIVLLLLWRRRRSKDLSSNRLNQPESINPASATNHEVTQNDGSVYSSLLHGDTSLYETIQLSRASGNAEKIHHPAEESIYANC